MDTNDTITIIRDIEELKRLGIEVDCNDDGTIKVLSNTDIPDDILNKLNSYNGVVKRINYYDQSDIFDAISIVKSVHRWERECKG